MEQMHAIQFEHHINEDEVIKKIEKALAVCLTKS